jgi:phthiocerol/phenolphthiocerol synthesis type-I polyketide synthase C
MLNQTTMPSHPPRSIELTDDGSVAGRRAVVDWLSTWLARKLKIAREDIGLETPFSEYGLDSLGAIEIAGELAQWLGRDLPETLLYEHTTITQLADHLADATRGRADRVSGFGWSTLRIVSDIQDESIAVVGLSCRFPAAEGPEAFWSLLCEGRDGIREVPPDRYGPSQDEAIRLNSRTNAPRFGGFLDDVAAFDAAFFNISPREAVTIDPQQRMLLEVCYEALEDSCEPPRRIAGSNAGVFVGIGASDYSHLLMDLPELPEGYAATGTAPSVAAGRISYAFDLHGPSVAVDAACASSLYAVHLACQSLRLGECALAIAAGANALLIPEPTLILDRLGMLSPDGHCKAFDARADGYVRSEGAGATVLKPLRAAIEDGNPVYCVIRGGAVNSDGRSNGLSAPNRGAQERVIADALGRAGVRPNEVRYVETQGTGTRLGDAVEASALNAAIRAGRSVGQHCLIGSVKTNVGHLEAAAGIASLIKTALALTHRALPATLNYESPNSVLQAGTCALRVQKQLDVWPQGPGRLTAGVSAFGFSGTNVHIVVQEAPNGLAPVLR